MAQVPSPGARIIHDSEFVTEYNDGTEEVRFSETEWEIMSKDPRFGYIGTCGHSTLNFLSNGSCPVCEAAMSVEESDSSSSSLSFAPAHRESVVKPQTKDLDNDEIPF